MSWLLSICMCFLGANAWAETVQEVPALTGPVMDQAQMMSVEERDKLDQALRQYAREKGSQIQILTVNTTAPEDVFSYGMRVVQAWKLGREREDDGVLLLIAKDDRKNQIFVGRGLEGAITDVDAHRILSETVRPHFQAEDYDEGIVAAVTQLQGLIAGEALPEPTVDDEFEGETWEMLLGLFLPLLIFTTLIKKVFGRQLGSLVCAALVAGLLWFIGIDWLLIFAVSVGVYLFSVIVNVNVEGGGGGGGYYDGGDGGGWSSGGGSSYDSGYSGGGGSFSGGGASGDW